MIQVNDTVLYGVHGVCKVTAMETREVAGQQREYYVLKPVFDRGTVVYVPTWNPRMTEKLHRILSPKEIYQMIRTMPNEEQLWVENEGDRKRVYHQALVSGDREQLVRLIKTLYLRQQKRAQQKKTLLLSDEKFMKEAERILYEEFAYVLKIDRDQVLPLIMQEIQVEEK
ncbi:MAG: CarD family transcriptional regulator [Clostridia bacterium]|nr:CarD family transcriptional regulator [Clostridia bacterium]